MGKWPSIVNGPRKSMAYLPDKNAHLFEIYRVYYVTGTRRAVKENGPFPTLGQTEGGKKVYRFIFSHSSLTASPTLLSLLFLQFQFLP